MANEATAPAKAPTRSLTLGISEKGAIMVLGLRKFPVTFYADEWEALGKMAPHIERFAQKHGAELKSRQDKQPKNVQGRETFAV